MIVFIGISPARRCSGRSITRTDGNAAAHCSAITGESVSIRISSTSGTAQQGPHHVVEERGVTEHPVVLARHPFGVVAHGDQRHHLWLRRTHFDLG